MQSCVRIGVAYESDTLGEAADPESAKRYFERACTEASEEQRELCVLSLTVANTPPEEARAGPTDAGALRAHRT